ncbi:TolC family protein [Ferruginibacter albus]|uniref:TolC family protein n=1 Tax=Ferruginibacter albus TaxID=2875540 RepID=UPI001CC5826B|nr:TolC family protein [Ferruginibacter albus]
MIRTTGFLIALTLMSTRILAQDSTRTITLKEAINLSIQNSKILKNSKAKIDEATAAVSEANERKLPDFSVSGAYLYLPFQPNINIAKNGSDTSGGGGGTPKVNQAIYGIASVSYPVFTGGKLKYGVESAKYLAEAVKLDADNNRGDVIMNTINAYSNLYKAKAAVELVKQNLDQSNQRVKDFSNLEQNGLLARNDLLKVQLQSSNVELALLDAESNYKVSIVNMDLLLGLPETTIIVPDSASLWEQNQVKSIDDYEQSSLQNRKDLAALTARKKAADLGIKLAHAEYYPSLALTGGYIAADIPGFVSITNAVNIGIGVKYELSSLWKTKTKIAEAKAKSDQLSASQEMLNDNIKLQINQAYQNYLVSQKKIEVYQKAVEQANENYRITKNKYDNALETLTDLLDADVSQLQTRLNAANAVIDANTAYNKLLQAAGLLNN